jgi:hypothetical protein
MRWRKLIGGLRTLRAQSLGRRGCCSWLGGGGYRILLVRMFIPGKALNKRRCRMGYEVKGSTWGIKSTGEVAMFTPE